MKPIAKSDNNPPVPPTLEEMAGAMLKELGLKEKDDPGFTAEEYAEVWGVAYTTAKTRIFRLKKRGRIVVGRRIAKDTMGRRIEVPVYRLKDEDAEERE